MNKFSALVFASSLVVTRGSWRPLPSWDLTELGHILDHPALGHGPNDILHTISFEEVRGRKGRSFQPKQRSHTIPGEAVASHRYVEYGDRTSRRKMADIANMANGMFDDEEGTEMSSGIAKDVHVHTDKNTASVETSINEVPPQTEDAHHQPPPMDFRDPIISDAPIYQPIRIHFDASELHDWRDEDPLRVNYLVNKVLPGLATVWSSALNVVPVTSSLQIDYAWCPFGSPQNQAFTGGITHTDLVVFVTANSAACDGGRRLATASSCYWDQYERPTAGVIDFCLETIETKHLVSMAHANTDEDDELLFPELDLTFQDPAHDRMLQLSITAAAHEFSHLLGVTPDDMIYFYDSETGTLRTPQPIEREVECTSGVKEVKYMPDEGTLQGRKDRHGELYYEVTLPTVTQVVRNHFDCQTLSGARLENQDDYHCFGSQFEQRLFMGGGATLSILSPTTLALLQDSGWYLPNYRVAKISPWGHGAGCDFVDKDCFENGIAGPGFCKERTKVDNHTIEGEYGCDPSYKSIGVCNLVDYAELGGSGPPKRYQYFPDHPTLGAFMATADYCPTYTMATTTCRQMSSSTDGGIPSLPEAAKVIESAGHQARCFPTVDEARPICLNVVCDAQNRTVTIEAGSKVYICLEDGRVLDLHGVKIKCPQFSHICPESICPANCAGRGVCDFQSGRCHCSDPNDASRGCYDTIIAVPPQYVRGWPASGAKSMFLVQWTAMLGLGIGFELFN